jgi:hypothetical protein
LVYTHCAFAEFINRMKSVIAEIRNRTVFFILQKGKF